jgi:hypothetical protein
MNMENVRIIVNNYTRMGRMCQLRIEKLPQVFSVATMKREKLCCKIIIIIKKIKRDEGRELGAELDA